MASLLMKNMKCSSRPIIRQMQWFDEKHGQAAPRPARCAMWFLERDEISDLRWFFILVENYLKVENNIFFLQKENKMSV